MIMFYFSATGNSKYVAELFSSKMGAKCYSIEDDADFASLIDNVDTVGFCYPIYGSRVPQLMREFAALYSKALYKKKLIIFCTQMGGSGDGARAFLDVLLIGDANVIYAEHFLMPNNVCNLFILPLAGKKRTKWYLAKTHALMDKVCENIRNGRIKKRGFNSFSQMLGLVQGALFPIIEKRAKGKVWIDSDCNQCGICVAICPMNNFENGADGIIAKANCMVCYRCINKCPQKAIAVFFRRKVKRQYAGIE